MTILQDWIIDLLSERGVTWTESEFTAVKSECVKTRAVTHEEVEQIIDKYLVKNVKYEQLTLFVMEDIA